MTNKYYNIKKNIDYTLFFTNEYLNCIRKKNKYYPNKNLKQEKYYFENIINETNNEVYCIIKEYYINGDLSCVQFKPFNFFDKTLPEQIYINKNNHDNVNNNVIDRIYYIAWGDFIENKYIKLLFHYKCYSENTVVTENIQEIIKNNKNNYTKKIKLYNNDQNNSLKCIILKNIKTNDTHTFFYKNNKLNYEVYRKNDIMIHRENNLPAKIEYDDNEDIYKEHFIIEGEYKRVNNNDKPTIIEYSNDGDTIIHYYTDIYGNTIKTEKLYGCFTKCSFKNK